MILIGDTQGAAVELEGQTHKLGGAIENLTGTSGLAEDEFAALNQMALGMGETFVDLTAKTQMLSLAIMNLKAQGVSVSGAVSLSGTASVPTAPTSTSVLGSAMTTTLVINYNPVLSMADAYQLEQILTPIVRRITTYQ